MIILPHIPLILKKYQFLAWNFEKNTKYFFAKLINFNDKIRHKITNILVRINVKFLIKNCQCVLLNS